MLADVFRGVAPAGSVLRRKATVEALHAEPTRAFLKNGVRVYAYPGMTHVKAALYDGWAIVGSANFDKLSLRVNGETCIATSDPGFVGALRRDLFERDFARATEVTVVPEAGWTTYVADFVADQL